MARIRRTDNNKCWWGCGEIGSLIHCWWKCKMVQPLWKTLLQFLRKLNIGSTTQNSTLRYIPRKIENIYSHKNLYINVHSSIILNSQKVETTQMFIDWWMDKQNVVVVHSGILFGHKRIKKWSADTCYHKDEPWKHYAKWKKPDGKDHILYDFIYMKCPEWANLWRQKLD